MAAFDIATPTVILGASVTGVGRFNAAPSSLVTRTYRQRAWNTVLDQYVFWQTVGAPDTSGATSGYPVSQLTSITVVSQMTL